VSAVASFTARIRAQRSSGASNPYVEIPERVSRAFASFVEGGRITVDGTLNAVSIRGTLVPVGRGRHRLYINGGMRAAAGVGVGDRVSLRLAGRPPRQARPPDDLTAALRAARAQAAFAAWTASRQREMIRYVDDARTPEGRRRRIGRVVAQAQGQPHVAAKTDASKPLWTCPKCGHEFANRNQWHSCKRFDLSVPFAGKPAFVRELFEGFRQLVERCGPVKVLPYRHRVGFMVRVRFAGATPRQRWLDAGFWLRRRIASPRFSKVETIMPNVHLYQVRISKLEQLDAELAGWLREAYAIGCQAS
jgi:hypothetical protein